MKLVGLFFTGLLSLAYAGHETGNSGGGVVCRDSSGKIKSVKLLDFWEAETLRNWKISSHGTLQERLKKATQKLGDETKNPQLAASTLEKTQKILQTKMSFIADLGISTPRDILNRYVKKGCPIEGIASFDDVFMSMDVDEELYSKLSDQDIGGLIFHEAIYYILRRDYGHNDSNLARYITGCVFSTSQCPEIDKTFELPNEKSTCHLEGKPQTRFSAFKTSEGDLRFQFSEVDGKPVLARAFFTLDSAFGCTLGGGNILCTGALKRGPAFLRASDERWKDVGFNRRFELAVDSSTSALKLDGQSVKCQ